VIKLFFLLALFALIFPNITHAAIIQGNASATVNVTTNVEGQRSVSTHIVTSVNGDTEEYNSSKSGSVKIEQTDNSYHVQENATDNTKATPSAMPLQKIEQQKFQSNSLQQFVKNFQNFFTNFFRWL
jgi:hypothetical protein